jgi:hypothetical protein
MKTILSLILATAALSAQIQVKISPEPLITITDVLADARGMQRYSILMCNVGTAPRLVAWGTVAMSTTVPFIPIGDATQVLTTAAARSTSATILHWASVGAQLAAIGMAATKGISSSNGEAWTLGLGIGGTYLPQIAGVIAGTPPTATPLLNQLQYPVTLQPVSVTGQCLQDYEFTPSFQSYHGLKSHRAQWVPPPPIPVITIP